MPRAAFGAEGGGDLLGPVAVEVGDDDAGAVAGQQLGDRPADARRRAGDEGDAALQRGAGGRMRSLRSSSSQYSMRNFSRSSIGEYVDTASAPRITLIALM